MSLRYWVMIVVLGSGWGGSFYFNEILLREVGPLTVSMGRVGLGALGCWLFVFGTGRSLSMTPSLLVQLLFLGVLQFAIPFAIYPVSQEYIESGAAGIINALTPIMVVITSHFWRGGERATAAKLFGVLFGFAGIVILALPAMRGGGGSQLWAIMIALIAPMCYAVGLNVLRGIKGVDSSTMVAVSLTGATLFIAPLALMIEGTPVVTHSETFLAFGAIGLVLTAAAMIALYWLFPRVGATNASTVTFIAPISAILLGTFLLGETMLPSHFMGMAAIFCGLLMIDGRIVGRFTSV